MRRAPIRRARRGFTLAELMISLVLFGLVMATGMQVLVRQQRFHRGANQTVEMRGNLRHASAVLPADLRAIYPAGGDVTAWSRGSISFRAITASAVVCLKPTATQVLLPPLGLTQNNTLSTWMSAPQVGDSILVYDENVGIGNDDDLWRAYRITAIATVVGASACPVASGFTVAADAAKPSYLVTLSAAMPTTIVPGAPVRAFRPTTYEIYQAGDDRWYLGVSDCIAGRTPACSDPQPVSGPYRPFSLNTDISGLTFWYFSADGTALDPDTDDPATIARIQVVVRGETATPFNSSSATGTYRDSLSFIVGLRNRD